MAASITTRRRSRRWTCWARTARAAEGQVCRLQKCLGVPSRSPTSTHPGECLYRDLPRLYYPATSAEHACARRSTWPTGRSRRCRMLTRVIDGVGTLPTPRGSASRSFAGTSSMCALPSHAPFACCAGWCRHQAAEQRRRTRINER